MQGLRPAPRLLALFTKALAAIVLHNQMYVSILLHIMAANNGSFSLLESDKSPLLFRHFASLPVTSCAVCESGKAVHVVGRAAWCLIQVHLMLMLFSGKLCATQNSAPTTCGSGQYNTNPAATSCTDCPAGFYCPDPSSAPLPCPAGEKGEAQHLVKGGSGNKSGFK